MDVRQFNTTPPYLFGNEIDFLEATASQLPDHAEVVMLGVGPAMMVLAMLSGNPNLIVSGYDTDNFTGVIHVEQAGHAGQLLVTKKVSWLAADAWEDESVDLLLVDACHDQECVVKDIQAWWSKIKPGGILFFHDYITPEGELTGVFNALHQCITDEWVLLDTPGISAVYKKHIVAKS
jgi:hypothetical protein